VRHLQILSNDIPEEAPGQLAGIPEPSALPEPQSPARAAGEPPASLKTLRDTVFAGSFSDRPKVVRNVPPILLLADVTHVLRPVLWPRRPPPQGVRPLTFPAPTTGDKSLCYDIFKNGWFLQLANVLEEGESVPRRVASL